MKKTTIYLAMMIFVITSCKNNKTETTEVVETKTETKTQTPGFTEIDLSSNGMKLTMSVPDSVKDKIKINKVSEIQVNGEVGEYGFTVYSPQQIDESENLTAVIKEHMDDKKKDITKDENNKFKRYIKEEANCIFWESDDHGAVFSFCVIVPVGNNAYYEIVNNGSFSSEAAQNAILNYVKTMKPKAG